MATVLTAGSTKWSTPHHCCMVLAAIESSNQDAAISLQQDGGQQMRR